MGSVLHPHFNHALLPIAVLNSPALIVSLRSTLSSAPIARVPVYPTVTSHCESCNHFPPFPCTCPHLLPHTSSPFPQSCWGCVFCLPQILIEPLLSARHYAWHWEKKLPKKGTDTICYGLNCIPPQKKN